MIQAKEGVSDANRCSLPHLLQKIINYKLTVRLIGTFQKHSKQYS